MQVSKEKAESSLSDTAVHVITCQTSTTQKHRYTTVHTMHDCSNIRPLAPAVRPHSAPQPGQRSALMYLTVSLISARMQRRSLPVTNEQHGTNMHRYSNQNIVGMWVC
jgi:hypothetical protein